MRTPDEIIVLLRQVIHNRREYVREKLQAVERIGRETQPLMERMLRGGMLSELTTIECVLTELERGNDKVLQYWTKASESDESA